jgi:signal transduction histidine kinase
MQLEAVFPNSDGVKPASRHRHGPSASAQDMALAGTMQQLIDGLPEEVALLDQSCNILTVNHAWHRTMIAHGIPESQPGTNYRDLCVMRATEGYQPAAEALAALDEIMLGTRDSWQLTYNGGERWGGRDFQISFHRILVGAGSLISVTRCDLTEIFDLRHRNHDLSDSLIASQTVERQRFARELHDSTSQLLTGIGLLLGRLQHDLADRDCSGIIAEMQGLLGEAKQEIRSISYLAHPPALERMGLVRALRSLAEGFGQRTNLEASFEIEGHPVILSPAIEGAIYRIAQEALSNVHRHARATRFRLRLCFRRSVIHLAIVDDGTGFSRRKLADAGGPGVGLAGMQSRLAEIEGRLSVRNLSPGTAIVASARRRDKVPA